MKKLIIGYIGKDELAYDEKENCFYRIDKNRNEKIIPDIVLVEKFSYMLEASVTNMLDINIVPDINTNSKNDYTISPHNMIAKISINEYSLSDIIDRDDMICVIIKENESVFHLINYVYEFIRELNVFRFKDILQQLVPLINVAFHNKIFNNKED